ncbi:MAG: hypothetical protein QOC73_2510, partial [Actinomycetota bacterium]|nr:hypothetical protein [Actinomycetota bacterium]
MTAMTVRRRCLKATASLALVCTAGAVGLLAAAPAALAAPSVVVVSSSSYGPQSDGFLYIVGETKNTGAGPITGISVTIGLYNSANVLLTTDDVASQVSVLAPGEKGGFLDIVTPPAGYASYKVLGVSAADAAAAGYHRFAVTNVHDVPDSAGVHDITGTVTNAGYYSAQNVRLFFTFYNQAGTVVDVDSQLLPAGTLNIAASGTFDEHNIPASIHYTSFALVVEGAVNAPPCGPCVPFTRIAGPTRIETSVAASLDQFPAAGSASA